MRYRPFGASGQTVSAVTMAIGEKPDGDAARTRLIYAALEAGVNAFELRDPGAGAVLGRALQVVERRMVVVTLRITGQHRLDQSTILSEVEKPLLAGRLGRFDAVIVQDPTRLTEDGWRALAAVRDSGRARQVGVAGAGSDVDDALARVEPDLLVTAYHLGSAWADRHRMARAAEARRTLVGEGYHPSFEAAAPGGAAPKRGLFGLFQKPASIEKADGYGFLARTPGWAADEICLAHALAEPGLATVVLDASTPEDVERLAAVTERELPTGLPAQIEMARFAAAA